MLNYLLLDECYPYGLENDDQLSEYIAHLSNYYYYYYYYYYIGAFIIQRCPFFLGSLNCLAYQVPHPSSS
jgi:hypothetical protein